SCVSLTLFASGRPRPPLTWPPGPLPPALPPGGQSSTWALLISRAILARALLCVFMPTDDYRAWLQGLHADYRFGEHDRLGTANYIDFAARRRAVEAVVDGTPISLARPLVPGP